MHIKICIGLATINQLLVQLLLGNISKISHNLISYTRLKTNLVRLKIISYLNKVFFIININLFANF